MDVEPTALLVERIDAVLPQTQCRCCGHAGCRPYAEAVAGGDAINRCPPGGDAVIHDLAALTARPAVPLDAAHGRHGPLTVAHVDAAACIGCVLCREACPVDAIVGAAKRLHVVLPALCTGCGLCLPPCPVDCIALRPAGRSWSAADAAAARRRFDARARHGASPRADTATPRPGAHTAPVPFAADRAFRREAVAAATARARGRRAARALDEAAKS